MSRKPKNHIPGVEKKFGYYADSRSLDFHQYSPYHMRIMDGGYVVLDVWTTGRYYIVMTDYNEMTDGAIVERAGEKGSIPSNDMYKLSDWLDKIFFPGKT